MTDYVQEPARQIPVACEVDVCVLGGSCTGVFAAVAAAQAGARVALVENNGFFGGVASAGLVNIWHRLYDMPGKQQIIAGLTQEVIDRLGKRKAAESMTKAAGQNQNQDAWLLNTEELKIDLDEMVRDAGVKVFLHAKFADVIHEDGTVQAALIEDKSGRRAIRAKVFIDATGDSDLVVRMGLGFTLEQPLQPPTMCAFFAGMDKLREVTPSFGMYKFSQSDEFRGLFPKGFLWSSRVVGASGMEMVAGTRVHGANCADGDELTHAEMEGRRQVRALADLIRKTIPGGEAISIQNLPSYIGIRETRHSACLHTLTEEEVLRGVRFDDAIANGTYQVDIHHSEKPGITFRYLTGVQKYIEPGKEAQETRWREDGDTPPFYQIPYRSLVPLGTKNVLVAGRCLGCDKAAFGAIRVMVNTNQTGEAAGVAAAQAVQSGCAMDAVNTTDLRAALSARGAAIF